MNWADWVIVGIVALSSLISLARGFVKEALSLVIWGAAFFIAMIFGPRLSMLLTDFISTPSLRSMAAFALLFAGTLLVGSLISYLSGALVKMTGMGGTDRLLGTIFGFIRGVIIVLAVLILVPPLIPVDQDPWWRESALIPQLLMLESWARQTIADIGALMQGWLGE